MDIHSVPIHDLKIAEYNPRKASVEEYEQLRRSLQEFGFVEPVIVNKFAGRENTIVGGHFRVRVAKDLGFTDVPVVYVELPEDKERELNLRLNKNTGQWDYEKLLAFNEPMLLDVGFSLRELHSVINGDTLGGGGAGGPKEATCPACGETFPLKGREST